jgi:hypothetical protein
MGNMKYWVLLILIVPIVALSEERKCSYVGSDEACQRARMGDSCALGDLEGKCAAGGWLGGAPECKCVRPQAEDSTNPNIPLKCYSSNPFGTYAKGGGCNTFGCWPPGGSCNAFGCSTDGRCLATECLNKIKSYQCR